MSGYNLIFVLIVGLIASLAFAWVAMNYEQTSRYLSRSAHVSAHETVKPLNATHEPYDANSKSLSIRDLVATLGSSGERLPIAHASEAWHKDKIRVVIGLNEKYLVDGLNSAASKKGKKTRYWYYPDVPHKGQYPGDYRLALLPFQAAKDLEYKFKWMLLGDDDTIWYLPNVIKLLEPFDHNLPYAISDFLLYPDELGPSIIAPRCLPCHWDNKNKIVDLGFDWPKRGGCEKGCTPEIACGARTYKIDQRFPAVGTVNGSTIPLTPEECIARGILDKAYTEGPCPLECTRNAAGEGQPLVTYGGSGMIFSVGLLKQFPPERAAKYYDLSGCNGCDCFITRMLWNNSVAFTDPGYGLATLKNKKDLMRKRLFSDAMFDIVMMKVEADLCFNDPYCRWYLSLPVSQHLHARAFERSHKEHPLQWVEAAANWTRYVVDRMDKAKADLEVRGLLGDDSG